MRMLILAGLRITAVILLSVGGFALINMLVISQPWRGGIQSLFTQFSDGASWLGTGLGCALTGVVLLVASHRITRWIVPAPQRECMQCGYQLATSGPTPARCPECGLVVTGGPPEKPD